MLASIYYARSQVTSLPYVYICTICVLMLRYACALLEKGSAWQGRAVCSPSGTRYRTYVSPLRLVCVCVRMYSRAVCSPSSTPICVFSHTTASCSTRYYMLQLCCSSVAAVASQARLYACSRILLRPVVLDTICCSCVAALLQLLHLRHAYTRVLAYYCVL